MGVKVKIQINFWWVTKETTISTAQAYDGL